MITNSDRILNFFDNLDEVFNTYIDRVEITPIRLTSTIFITGFKRSFNNSTALKVHLKEVKNIKGNDIEAYATSDGGYNLMDNDGELWLNTYAMSPSLLGDAITAFIKKYGEIKTVHIGTTKWKDETDTYTKMEVTVYESKKVACKEVLNFRKLHQNVHTTFEALDINGNAEPSDFELVTCEIK